MVTIVMDMNHSIISNLTYDCPVEPHSRKLSIAEAVACVISMLTVLENLVILTTILRGPKSLRKPPYWFIASLSAADMLTGLEVVLAVFVPIGTSPLYRIFWKVILHFKLK